MPLSPVQSNGDENELNGLSLDYYPLFLSSLYNNKDKSIINNIYLQKELENYYAKIGANFYTKGNYTGVTPSFSLGYNPTQNSNINFDYTASKVPFYNLNYSKRF